jgi:hypothetical protein
MKVKVEGRKWAILGFVLLTVISLIFITCKPSFGYLRVEKIHLPSENTELTKKVSDYPVSEIVNSSEVGFSMDISLKDYEELEKLLKNGNCIKLNGSYYYVDLTAFVGVRKLDQAPASFVNLTPEELGKYSSLNLSLYHAKIEGGEDEDDSFTAESEFEEVLAISELIQKRGKILEYGGNYYEIFFRTRVVFREFLNPASCVLVGEEELKGFPALKRGLKEAEKTGSAVIRAPVGEIDKCVDVFGVIGCVYYNGSYYRLTFAKPMG